MNITLSKPSKLPCQSYSLPATACKVGSKLRKIPGSVCSKCYACKGNYVRFPKIQESLERRLEAISDPQWVPTMIDLIKKATKKTKYFRWHDSGDIQSVEHFVKIIEIAKELPDVMFWLPTKEVEIIYGFMDIPSNLIIRVSSPMIDGTPPDFSHTSTSVTKGEMCPASKQGGKCVDCRMCWDKDIKNVSYLMH